MKRRRALLVMVTGGLCAIPLAVKAQQTGKVYRIGYLIGGAQPVTAADQGPFPERMRELGWVYGRDLWLSSARTVVRSSGSLN